MEPGPMRAEALAIDRGAVRRRFFSAVSVLMSCRRRARGPSSGHLGGGGTSGRITSAKWARICASRASVLANWLAGRPRKVQNLSWIHHDDREAVGGECACEEHFKLPSGLEHNEHWEGIAAYCKPENKIAMGFVVGVSKKIRVIRRRATTYARRSSCV